MLPIELLGILKSLYVFCLNKITSLYFSYCPCSSTKSSGAVWNAVAKFPVAIGIVVVSMLLTSCGGVALIFASCIYFVLVSVDWITKNQDD